MSEQGDRPVTQELGIKGSPGGGHDATTSLCGWAVPGINDGHSLERTREHALGQQFADLIGGPSPYKVDRIHLGEDSASNTSKTWTSRDPTNWVTRAFCGSCNNGWMARMDDAAYPVVAGLMAGPAISMLRPADGTVLACWAYKLALVFEFVARGGPAQADTVRADFIEHRRPPDHAAVVLGRTSSIYANALYGIRRAEIVPGPEPVRAAVFTLVLRHLIVQVAYHQTGLRVVPPLDLLPLRHQARLEVHPPRLIPSVWPPPLQLTDDRLLRSVISGAAPYPDWFEPRDSQTPPSS